MRKSSILILLINILCIILGLYLIRNHNLIIANYAIDQVEYYTTSKLNVILIGLTPFVIVATMDVIATLEADEVKPFIKYYDRVKFVASGSFQLLYLLIILSQIYSINERNILGIIFTALIAYIGYVTPHITRNTIVGFKNKWTLEDDMIWDKVHKRLGLILYLVSVLLLALTLTKHFVTLVLTIFCIAIILIYLYWYSYQLSKNS